MNLLEALLTRRSIRKYKAGNISQQDIDLIVKAGMYAPTARNTMSNHFIVIDKRDLLDAIQKAHPHAAMLKEATLCIIVCGDKNLEKEDNYLAINGSAATQNVLLAVHGLGLGAVWLGVYGRPERMNGISDLLNLPPDIIPISAIAIGIPNETKVTPDRFDTTKYHINKW